MFLRHRREGGAPDVQLPVTPMLDMTFQLLAFFLLTYHPSALEGEMEFSLPATGHAGPHEPTAANPGSAPAPDPAELNLQITVQLRAQKDGINDGVISNIVVRVPEGEHTVANMSALAELLKRKLDRGEMTKKDIVQIQAEGGLKYAFIVEAVDACRKVGVQGVGFAAPPDASSVR